CRRKIVGHGLLVSEAAATFNSKGTQDVKNQGKPGGADHRHAEVVIDISRVKSLSPCPENSPSDTDNHQPVHQEIVGVAVDCGHSQTADKTCQKALKRFGPVNAIFSPLDPDKAGDRIPYSQKKQRQTAYVEGKQPNQQGGTPKKISHS